MALDAVVFQQEVFGYQEKDLCTFWCDHFLDLGNQDQKLGGFDHFLENQTENPSSTKTISGPAKRRRSKGKKNKEELENQRMTHITVERNRRRQMNDYLSALRSLMPESYALRGDQASIVGGAINYVKELEHRLQFLNGISHNKINQNPESSSSLPFDEFFNFPQYSTEYNGCDKSVLRTTEPSIGKIYGVVDVEATMVESHGSIKIRARRRARQLIKMVSGFQNLRLTILHLNVTTIDHIVLYSISVKIEDDCKVILVDDIAKSIYQLLVRIQEDDKTES